MGVTSLYFLLDNSFLVLHLVVSVGMALRLIYRKLSVPLTLAWILLIALLPAMGLLLYFLFGSRKLDRKRRRLGTSIRDHYLKAFRKPETHVRPKCLDDFPDVAKLIQAMTGFSPVEGNKVELLDGDAAIYARMIADIQAASSTLYAEFYIVDAKGRPEDVLEAMEAAARRGVDVKLLVDAYGSRRFLNSNWADRLRVAGADVESSLSVNLFKMISKRTDLRNHRKILVIDQTVGYVGSCNLTDPHLFKPDDGVWVDMMARVEGPAAENLSVVMAADFLYDKVGDDFTYSDLQLFPEDAMDVANAGEAVCQILPSGPEMERSVFYEVLMSAIFSARESIRIVTPYFVPDDAVILALSSATRRGVAIELIVPAEPDSVMVCYAGSAAFDTLMDAGVRVGWFRGGMLHTKALLIDGQLAFVGTVNMDQRSFYLNLEVTMVCYDAQVSADLDRIIDGYADKSEWLDPQQWNRRGRWQRFKENSFRLVSPLL